MDNLFQFFEVSGEQSLTPKVEQRYPFQWTSQQQQKIYIQTPANARLKMKEKWTQSD
jgi:hypothetical protein